MIYVLKSMVHIGSLENANSMKRLSHLMITMHAQDVYSSQIWLANNTPQSRSHAYPLLHYFARIFSTHQPTLQTFWIAQLSVQESQ